MFEVAMHRIVQRGSCLVGRLPILPICPEACIRPHSAVGRGYGILVLHIQCGGGRTGYRDQGKAPCRPH